VLANNIPDCVVKLLISHFRNCDNPIPSYGKLV